MTERKKLSNAEKIALAKARMNVWGVEPITTRAWKPAVAHVAPKHVQLASVTTIRRRKP
jgi:hypothetical protein